MLNSAILAATIMCTSQVVPSADPHGSEYITQIEISSDGEKGQLRTYKYEAWELWGAESVESVLTNDHLAGPPQIIAVEEVSHAKLQDELRAYELYSTDGWHWTLDSILKVNGTSSERILNYGSNTHVQKMTCK